MASGSQSLINVNLKLNYDNKKMPGLRPWHLCLHGTHWEHIFSEWVQRYQQYKFAGYCNRKQWLKDGIFIPSFNGTYR